MKRFYSMLLALLMIFSLCACGAGSNMAKSESAPAEPMAAADMMYSMNTAGGFGMAEEAMEAEMGGEDNAPDTDEQTTDTEEATESQTEADTTPPPENDAFLICIDPGHGFGDGGTSSEFLGDVTERDVNMAVAKNVYDLLHDAGYNVVLSHDGVTIPDSPLDDGDDLFYIDERVSFTNHIGADLFVSIHCDSFDGDTSVYGTRVYYCSQNKYSDASADLVEKLKISIDDELPEAKDVLTYPKNLSSAYYVTAYTECPSALIELGFVTNESDAQSMLDETWRHDIAYAIAMAISVYVNENVSSEQ